MVSLTKFWRDLLFSHPSPPKKEEKKITCIHCKNRFTAREANRITDSTWQGAFSYCPRCGFQIGFKPYQTSQNSKGWVVTRKPVREMTIKKSDII